MRRIAFSSMTFFLRKAAVENIKQPTFGMPLYKSSCLLNKDDFVACVVETGRDCKRKENTQIPKKTF